MPEIKPGSNTAGAKQLFETSTIKEVDSDNGQSPTHGNEQAIGNGLDAIRGFRNVTPFLWMIEAYSRTLYTEVRDPAKRTARFRKNHKFLVGIAAALDCLVLTICLGVVMAGPVTIGILGVMKLFSK